jgi:cytidyltransferase-like protein
VPVLLREAERAVLGGAANVCANLAKLGAEVIVIGVIGRDEAGSVLADLFSARPKLNTEHLVTDINRPTTCKIRVMSGAHQMVRIDAESRAEVTAEVEEAVASAIRDSLHRTDVVVLSDYAKGLCTDRIIRTVIGTAVVSAKELDEALEADAHGSEPNKGASLSLDEAVRRREEWRKRGLRVGRTNGSYDLSHPGHISLLKSATAKCDRLIVAINSDALYGTFPSKAALRIVAQAPAIVACPSG